MALRHRTFPYLGATGIFLNEEIDKNKQTNKQTGKESVLQIRHRKKVKGLTGKKEFVSMNRKENDFKITNAHSNVQTTTT